MQSEERQAEELAEDKEEAVFEENSLSKWLYPPEEELPDDKEMTIFDHLEELRERLLVSVLAVGAAILGCFVFAKDLIVLLEKPVSPLGVRFLALSPGEYFFTTLKVKPSTIPSRSLWILPIPIAWPLMCTPLYCRCQVILDFSSQPSNIGIL